MLAYHGDEALKAATISTMREHREGERLAQNYGYWGGGKGCAVGCLTRDPSGGHETYPARWGIPTVLARLEDRIFEGLSPALATAWPERFLAAIPVGADLTGVWPRFGHAVLVDPVRGVARLCPEESPTRSAVEAVGALFRRQVSGELVSVEEWQRESAAAYAAAAAAAAAYAYASYADAAAAAAAYAYASYADAAAAAATDAYASYADAAAAAATDAYAYADARKAHYEWMADLLCRLLAEAPRG